MNDSQPNHKPADPREIARNVQTQIQVGIALVISTIGAVAVSFVPFQSQRTRIFAVISVAVFNAIMVSAISMHLKSEKNIIRQFLVFTLAFVFGLVALTVLALTDSTGLQ